jgi:outer membrane immunogenic protein
MKSLLLLGVGALVLAAAPAFAADISARPVIKAPAYIAPVSSWTGLHIGLATGLRANEVDWTTTSLTVGGTPVTLGTASTEPLNGNSSRIGGYIGYDWQFSSAFVAGIEGEIAWADKSVTLNGIALPGGIFTGDVRDSITVKNGWDASVRGRLGFLLSPTTLIYVTGGGAWQEVTASRTCCVALTANAFTPSNTKTASGWTIGTGSDMVLWNNWLVRSEYRYSDYGNVSFSDTSTVFFAPATATYDIKLKTHTVVFGLAYKF